MYEDWLVHRSGKTASGHQSLGAGESEADDATPVLILNTDLSIAEMKEQLKKNKMCILGKEST